jgi:acetyltransferase-like isoleucine patch superfamily enzyme
VKSNYTIYENVEIGRNVTIEPYCVIGHPIGGVEKQPKTIIGDNSIIRSHTVIYAGNRIGSNFSTGHSVIIREQNQVGNNVSIGTLSCIEHHIQLEDGVRIHSQAFIPEYSLVEKDAWVGPNVVITNAKYPRGKNVKEHLKGATIRKKAKIGANCTILPGITIGSDSLVGAGSVVTKDIGDGKVAYGNPAVELKNIAEIEEYEE